MKLREYLTSHGIKINFLANKMGVTVQYMHSIVSGKREPSLGLAVRIEEETKGKVKAKDLVLPESSDKAPESAQAAKKGRKPKPRSAQE